LATTTGTPDGGGGAAVCAVQLQTGEIKITAIKLLEKFINAISAENPLSG
jgi:hypothetical protein